MLVDTFSIELNETLRNDPQLVRSGFLTLMSPNEIETVCSQFEKDEDLVSVAIEDCDCLYSIELLSKYYDKEILDRYINSIINQAHGYYDSNRGSDQIKDEDKVSANDREFAEKMDGIWKIISKLQDGNQPIQLEILFLLYGEEDILMLNKITLSA